MAIGISRSADIKVNSQFVYAATLKVLYESSVLSPTVSFYRGQGMQGRKVTQYTDANVRTVGEGEDVTPTLISDADLSTLTPARYADSYLLTDQMMETSEANMVNVRADAALILGSAFAQDVDTNIATNYGSLTGGTVGSPGSALTWAHIFSARAKLQAAKVPPPYFCALHPYGWNDLVQSALVAGNALKDAPEFQDRLVATYFTTSIMGGVTFVVSSNIAVDGDDDAIGAMYSPLALALDMRKPFNIRPQRDESREAFELNASIWYAHGVWAPERGVQIIHDATEPS